MSRVIALLAAIALLPAASWPTMAAPTNSGSASQAFSEGTRLFAAEDYVGAIEAFTRAYQLKPHFLVMCNVALSYERMGDQVSAAEHYRRCLAEGGDKSRDADAVRNSLERVSKHITWVEVRSRGPGGTVFVDGHAQGAAPCRVGLNPGTRVIEVRRAGAEPARVSLVARGGDERSVELIPVETARPEPQAVKAHHRVTPRRLSPAWFWSSVAVTVTCGVVAAILGAQTLSIRSDYEATPSQELLDRGRNRRLLTNVFWIGAAVGAGASTGLFFYTDFKGGQERTSAGKSSAVVMGVQGVF